MIPGPGLLTVLALALALAAPQTTPSGGAIAAFVPPVPTPASFISDLRDVVPAPAQKALDDRIMGIQRAGLGDIAVAIIPSIGDYSANQVAVEIYRTWRVGSQAEIGSARRNVGVLILIVPKELSANNRGECWINTGTGAEGIITDATAGAICRDAIIPHLRNRDYASALGAGVSAIEARLRGDAGLTTAPSQGASDTAPARSRGRFFWGPLPFMTGTALVIAMIIGVRRWRRNRPRNCAKCGRPMVRLDDVSDDAKLLAGQVVEEMVGSVDYDVWTCQCGEFSVIPYRRLFTKYSSCRECRYRTASSTRKTMVRATTVSAGLAEDRFKCKHCKAAWVETVELPRISTSSSSGGGGGSGGGSSFGGSGSTSGGGGGGSY